MSIRKIRVDSSSSLKPNQNAVASPKIAVDPRIGRRFAPQVQKLLPQAAKMLASPLSELSIVFINDATMSKLHQQFMNDPSTTDVMTFPIELDQGRRPISGEVYVCIPEARRQAKSRGVPVEREVLLYALHGLLHLCGFDDRTDAGYRRMHRREDEILTHLGIGPVFAPGSASPPKKRRHA